MIVVKPSKMMRGAILAAARSDAIRSAVVAAPGTRAIVRRFVAGQELPEAVRVAGELVGRGLHVSLDHLGEDTAGRSDAEAMRDSCVAALTALAASGLTPRAEISVKLSSLGQALGPDGNKLATENAWKICEAASELGTTVTLDMEDHTTTDATLQALRELRTAYPWVGAVLQAYLHRTLTDARELSGPDSRVRLCKGAYREPASVAIQDPAEVDRNYVRCLRVLMEGQGRPMVATHDPRLIAIAGRLASVVGRADGQFEYQMLHGVRPDEQLRLAESGATVRVYVPFGNQWYPYLMRRLAERPANVAFFTRAVLTKG
ncbi:MAG TPA: proline dehydrogenase family protein [Sporichthyaceae bacterium]|jgi:proline dehydrogenase|nr:proline dehydrogenase family protein [Sporichthyaceae bacterium]